MTEPALIPSSRLAAIRAARAARLVALLAALAALIPAAARAQAPGLPVLQNAFFARGAAIGANYGGGGGASTLGAAASYAPLTGRLVLVVGAGSARSAGETQTTAGLRVAFRIRTFGASQQIGVAAFAGAGRTIVGKTRTSVSRAPFGASIAYRRALGTTRALAAYLAPYYDATRVSPPDSASDPGSRFRSSAGVDVAVTPRIGVGIGVDAGGKGRPGTLLAAGTQIGAGVSFRF